MKRDQAIKIEKKIMEALEIDFYEQDFDTDKVSASEYGIEEVLSFEFGEGLLASHYFMPLADEEINEHYFVQSIKVLDEVGDIRKKLEMLRAINLLNYNIPYGCFVFDQDIDVLTFRYTVTIDVYSEIDRAEEIAFDEAFIGLGIAATFVEPLKAYMEDLISWDGFVERVTESM